MFQKLYRRIRPIISDNRFIYGLLILLPVILYARWFNFDVFSYGDWSYKYVGNLRDLVEGSPWIANTNFGASNELIWRAPLDFMFGLFAVLGWGINVSEKFLIFWPLAITSMIAPYFLIQELLRNKVASFFGALFYATNTYFLAINPQGQQLLPLACNIATFAIAFFIRGLRRRSMPNFVAAGLCLWAAGSVDFRIFYIATMIMAGFTLYWRFFAGQGERLPWKKLFLFGCLVVSMEISWLLATYLTGTSSSDSVFSRSLFGGNYWTLSSAITLHHPFWNGVTTTWFMINTPPFYFWLAPVAAFSALLFYRRNRYILFFAFVTVVGILLSKQTNDPFSTLYPFLFSHLPGFNAFREATKFYYMIALGYSVLIATLIAELRSRRSQGKSARWLYLGFLTILTLFCFNNALPYVTNSMQKLLTPRTISQDYLTIAKQMDKTDTKQFYRTLWVPIAPRWSYYSQMHPRVNATALIGLPQGNDTNVNPDTVSTEQITDAINSPSFANYLAASSIKYIFVPTRDIKNQDDFFKFYGDDRQYYINLLNNSPALQKVNLGTTDVVAYENKQFMPYANATPQIFKVSDTANIDALFKFATNTLHKAFSFAIDTAKKPIKAPTTPLSEGFSDLTVKDITNGSITQTVNSIKGGTMYAATNTPRLSYILNDTQLTLNSVNATGLTINGQPAGGQPSNQSLGSVQLDASRFYFLRLGETITPIDIAQKQRNLGIVTDAPSIISTDKTNLVKDGSFEDGNWASQVEDCNKYDNTPNAVSMTLANLDATDGKWSLELSATSHIACVTSNKMSVTAGSQYLLSFDYKAPYAEHLSYKVSFDNVDEPVTTQKLGNGSQDWRTLRQVVTVPQGAHTMTVQLRGTPPPTYTFTNLSATTQYDNVRVQPLQTDLTTQLDTTPQYQTVPLPANNATIAYNDSSTNGQNLIKNGSLEKGLWQKKVGDCDNSDNNPAIGMDLVGNASDGKQALELTAQHHAACTGPEAVDVNEGMAYLLSFDRQSPNASSTTYTVSFNDPDRTVYKETIATTKDWQTFSRVIKTPIGATTASVKVYAYADSTDKMTIIQRYDNFKLIEVPDVAGQVYFVGAAPIITMPHSISYGIPSQTKKTITVKGATGPFYVSISEAYHNKWRLELNNGAVNGLLNSWFPLVGPTMVSAKDHIETDGYLNAWYVDPAALCVKQSSTCHKNADGSYDLSLVAEFSPQRWEYAAGLFSGTVVLGAVVYLIAVRRGLALPVGRKSRRLKVSAATKVVRRRTTPIKK